MITKMKLMLTLAALLLASAASHATTMGCPLMVYSQFSPYPQNSVAVFPGETFGFQLDIGEQLFPGPVDQGYFVNDFTVTFYGTKNGQPDIPNGEQYPGSFQRGVFNLTGFGNPGGVPGTYQRSVVIRYASGSHAGEAYCNSDPVTIYLY